MQSEGISSCGVPVVVTDASFGTNGVAASPVDREARYTRVGDSSMVAAPLAVDDSGGDGCAGGGDGWVGGGEGCVGGGETEDAPVRSAADNIDVVGTLSVALVVDDVC